jgi:hypothetical protein
MEKTCRLVILLALGGLVSGCSRKGSGPAVGEHTPDGKRSPAETASLALIEELNRAADILQTVVDEPSAKTAEPKLKAVARRLRKTMTEFTTFHPSKEEEARLRTRYWDSLNKASRRLRRAVDRVANNPEAREALKGSVAEFEKLSKKQQGNP